MFQSPEHRQQCWHIYYGDVHVGTIAERVGNPHDTDPCEWSCGFIRVRIQPNISPNKPRRPSMPAQLVADFTCHFKAGTTSFYIAQMAPFLDRPTPLRVT